MVEGLGFSSCFGGLSLRVFDHPSMGFTTSPLGFGGKSLRFRVGCFFGWGSATLDRLERGIISVPVFLYVLVTGGLGLIRAV